MRKTLYLKFIMAYILLCVIGIFVTAALGGTLIQNHLVSSYSSDLYAEADNFVSSHADILSNRNKSLDELYRSLKAVAAGHDSDIRIISPKGEVILNTMRPYSQDTGETIENFDYARFGPKYYEVSTFFHEYSSPHLTVMLPIVSDMTTMGYFAISMPMTELYEVRDTFLGDAYVVFFVNFGLSLFILFLFTFAVYRPLGKITEGAKEFASGNLGHRIRIWSNDEMGYLADTMNFMADELKKNTDYQRKFISNVSHDFRSPLTSIKGFSEAMCDGTIPPEMHERYLKIISSETERLEKLTRSVLTLNSMDQDTVILNIENFDINAMLRSTAEVFEGSCRKRKISIKLVLLGEQLMVSADREKIEQVVYNLLDNAVKFSDKNSEIELETGERHGKCFVTVRDEGCGIPKDHLTHIWDRFYKADNSRGKDRSGTGLGLSIVKEIISAHNQTISCVSTENVGTAFTFTLPLAKPRESR